MDEGSLSSTEAARLLGISEEEAGRLAHPDGRVPLEAVRNWACAAEERLMLMERVERIVHIEQKLAESEAELARLRGRGLLTRLLDRG